ncbi:MAG: phosphoribosylglycinamide formyltransferase [Acidobacteria bacterium]|nr:phosphoribosylglycinamide formyltransferase [Acidobacteriota bacterium]
MNRKLGILLSGRGSNFEAIHRAIAAGTLDAEIAVVISNREAAPGIETARRFGLKTVVMPSQGVPREQFDRELVRVLNDHQVGLVCLAGYMRLLSGYFVQAFPQRIVNIHPSLLPSFPGLDAQHQAFDYGVKFTGCTVHFVDEHLDNGPIILQAVVPVEEGDTYDTLSARILAEEHKIYSKAIGIILSGAYRIEGRRVVSVS